MRYPAILLYGLTLARSGGVDATPPPMSFSELDATPFGGSC